MLKWAVAKCAHHTRQKKRLTKPFDYKQKAKIKKFKEEIRHITNFFFFNALCFEQTSPLADIKTRLDARFSEWKTIAKRRFFLYHKKRKTFFVKRNRSEA